MAPKPKELRPLMTRIPEKLRAQLEKAAKRSGRSMNAELIHRLELTFRASGLTGEIDAGLENFEAKISASRAALAASKQQMEALQAETMEIIRQAEEVVAKLPPPEPQGGLLDNLAEMSKREEDKS